MRVMVKAKLNHGNLTDVKLNPPAFRKSGRVPCMAQTGEVADGKEGSNRRKNDSVPWC